MVEKHEIFFEEF